MAIGRVRSTTTTTPSLTSKDPNSLVRWPSVIISIMPTSSVSRRRRLWILIGEKSTNVRAGGTSRHCFTARTISVSPGQSQKSPSDECFIRGGVHRPRSRRDHPRRGGVPNTPLKSSHPTTKAGQPVAWLPRGLAVVFEAASFESGPDRLAPRTEDVPQTAQIIESLSGCLAGAHVVRPSIERPAVVGDLDPTVGTYGRAKQ